LQEILPVSSDVGSDGARAIERSAPPSCPLLPDEQPLLDQADKYSLHEGEEHTALDAQPSAIVGQPSLPEAYDVDMQEHCMHKEKDVSDNHTRSKGGPQCRQDTAYRWSTLSASHMHQDSARRKTWTRPEDTYGHNPFDPGADSLEACCTPSYEPAVAPGTTVQASVRDFGFPTSSCSTRLHAQRPLRPVPCCSHADEPTSVYQHKANVIGTLALGWSGTMPVNMPVTVICVPVVYPPQTCYPPSVSHLAL
jgi:hypothetical protein